MIVTRGAAFQAARGFALGVTGKPIASAPQHLLYFRPEPQGQGAERAIDTGAGGWVGGVAGQVAAAIGGTRRLVFVVPQFAGGGAFRAGLGVLWVSGEAAGGFD